MKPKITYEIQAWDDKTNTAKLVLAEGEPIDRKISVFKPGELAVQRAVKNAVPFTYKKGVFCVVHIKSGTSIAVAHTRNAAIKAAEMRLAEKTVSEIRKAKKNMLNRKKKLRGLL